MNFHHGMTNGEMLNTALIVVGIWNVEDVLLHVVRNNLLNFPASRYFIYKFSCTLNPYQHNNESALSHLMTDLPLVSIITPTYNRANYIRETIESVLSQEYPNFEYIILDDGSTDNTQQILATYDDPRMRWESHPNMGEARTVNKGWEMAQGKYIITVNSDDPVLPGLLSTTVKFMEEHPDVLVAYPAWQMIDENSNVMYLPKMYEYDYVTMLRWHYCMPSVGTIMRRTLFELEPQKRNPEYRYNGDWEYWTRAGLHGRFAHIPQVLATWRTHTSSMTEANKGNIAAANEHVRMVKSLYARPDLPAEMRKRKVKREVFAVANYLAALKCLPDQSQQARSYMLTSLWYAPLQRYDSPNRLKQRAWRWLFSVIIPPAIYEPIRYLWRGIKQMREIVRKSIVALISLIPIKLLLIVLRVRLRDQASQKAIKQELNRSGFHFLRKSYYLPIPEAGAIDQSEILPLHGWTIEGDTQLALAREIYDKYAEEFHELFPLIKDNASGDFYLLNSLFMAVDAHIYYFFIRHFHPKKIIEIGSGFSTKIAARACVKTAESGQPMPELIAIEPYPSDDLSKGFEGLDHIIIKKVEDVDLALFKSLTSGDILFIDSSHAFSEGSDVHHEYFKILPELAPGVIVHIHDINLPHPYLNVYRENDTYWNEQYILQAFLMYNPEFEILWCGGYMMENHPQEMNDIFPEIAEMRKEFPHAVPSSFWMRRVDPASKDQ